MKLRVYVRFGKISISFGLYGIDFQAIEYLGLIEWLEILISIFLLLTFVAFVPCSGLVIFHDYPVCIVCVCVCPITQTAFSSRHLLFAAFFVPFVPLFARPFSFIYCTCLHFDRWPNKATLWNGKLNTLMAIVHVHIRGKTKRRWKNALSSGWRLEYKQISTCITHIAYWSGCWAQTQRGGWMAKTPPTYTTWNSP